MEIIAKDAAAILYREMVDGHVAVVRRPVPARTADSDFMEVFRAEAKHSEELNIPSLLRYDEWHDGMWIMKLAPGYVSIYDLLTRRPTSICSPKAVSAIATAVVQHLDYLHRHGLWMVQLSAHNVLVNPTTLQIKVLPPLSPYLDLHRNIFDGQHGLAPEVATPSMVNNRADFYGLAALLETFGQFSPLPHALRFVVNQCHYDNPEQRLANTTELQRIIEKAGKQNKAVPYLIGAAAFAVLFGMYVFVGDDNNMPSNDSRYIKPQKHEPSPEGMPDTNNVLIEQYQQYLRDSIL